MESQLATQSLRPNLYRNQSEQAEAALARELPGAPASSQIALIQTRAAQACFGLPYVNQQKLVQRVAAGAFEGISPKELDQLLMQTAAMQIAEEPEYSKVAAAVLLDTIKAEVQEAGVTSFVSGLRLGNELGLIAKPTLDFAESHQNRLETAIDDSKSKLFEYFGLRTVYDRYLLRHPETRKVIETPQHFFMRVAAGLSQSAEEAVTFYRLISAFEYMPSTPTLFNSGTNHSQMSSCYLLNSPADSLESIYQKYTDVALLSKYAGGIGLAFHNIRSRMSLIRGTNGRSNGIIPFLKTLDSSVAAVNQGGKRKGACCVYLESWHADIIEFLSLRENTGDESMRTHNLNIANWIPDLFMERVEKGEMWSLFDPKDVSELPNVYGQEFRKTYLSAESAGLAKKTLPARDLYGMMMKTLAQTGNGWATFKDACNLKSNQTAKSENVIHLSNLCTEILEVTSENETAVCNLGSLNLSRYVVDGKFDFERLGQNAQTAIKFLDRVIDINFYPIKSAAHSNEMWRPVGLGIMGLQDVFFKLNLAFDSDAARELSRRIQEEIYFNALSMSCTLAQQFGPHEKYSETRAANGQLQVDLWENAFYDAERWLPLRKRIEQHGLRNSLVIAIAPTATIASITGAYSASNPRFLISLNAKLFLESSFKSTVI